MNYLSVEYVHFEGRRERNVDEENTRRENYGGGAECSSIKLSLFPPTKVFSFLFFRNKDCPVNIAFFSIKTFTLKLGGAPRISRSIKKKINFYCESPR